LNHSFSLLNGPLFIPANTIKTFNAAYTIPNQKITLLGVAPHMHLIGKSIEVYAEKPSKEVQNLIRITDWNFHWQGSYYFPKPVILTQGTKLVSKAIYDNTNNNPNNPNSPPKLVSLGEKTTDEMMLVYFTYLVYQNGDENIVIDSSALLDTKNISVSNLNELKLTRKGINQFTVEIEDKWLDGILNVYNVDGKSMLRRKINNNITELTLSNNITGIVFFQLEKNNQTIIKKVFVD
ncbi:MAG: hypothetical protein ABIO44_09085, partial [Saprospiraceae bacterium]